MTTRLKSDDQRFWLIVIGDAKSLKWVIENGRMGFRSTVKAADIKQSDPFIIYTSRGAYGNPTKDESQIAAEGRFSTSVINEEVTIGDETFPKSCAVKFSVVLPPRKGVTFRPLVSQLDFVGRSERRWPSAVHRTLVPLTQSDFRLLSAAVRGHLLVE